MVENATTSGVGGTSKAGPMALKEEGNAKFALGDINGAMEAYSAGIGAVMDMLQEGASPGGRFVGGAGGEFPLELLPTLFVNRSACLHKMGAFRQSLADAEQALSMQPMHLKAHHRKGQALIGLGYLEQARDAYSVALDGYPGNAFLEKFVNDLDAKTGRKSAHAKIESYIASNGTIKGCPTKLSLSMFELEKVLGEGNYSVVHKAVFRKTGEIFALKVVDKSKIDRMSKRNPNINGELRMEKQLLLRLNHPNIIKLFHTMQDASCLYFVIEFAPGGEVWSQMRFGKDSLVAIRPSKARFYAAQLVNALDYLRRSGIVHRDIKPENLIAAPVPGTGGRVELLKVIDFGTSFDLTDESVNGAKFVGTPEYMSPEAIAAKADPTPALDVWALGATLFQLNSGVIPFKGSSPYLTFLKTKALRYDMPEYFPDVLQDLVCRMFKKEPSERIGAKDEYVELKAHSYFQGQDFAELQANSVVPVPSLFELCVEAFGKVFTTGGEGDDAKPNPAFTGGSAKVAGKAKAGLIPAWSAEAGRFAPGKVEPFVRATLMGHLAQRLILGRPAVFRLFFANATKARFYRANRRKFAGLSEAEQKKSRDSFLVIHVGSLEGASPNLLERVARRINTLEPKPKLLVLGGALGDTQQTQQALALLDENVAIACVPDGRNEQEYEASFGDRYYSLYINGVLFIVIDSFLLATLEASEIKKAAEKSSKPTDINKVNESDSDDEQQDNTEHHDLAEDNLPPNERHAIWLEGEILQGKLCARHVIVLSHHAWSIPEGKTQPVDNSLVLPKPVANRFLDKLQDAGAQVVLAGGAKNSFTQTRKPPRETQTKLHLSNTAALVQPTNGPETDALVRTVRVQSSEVVSDKYLISELPAWLALEKEDIGDEQDEDNNKGFSDISDSSDEETL